MEAPPGIETFRAAEGDAFAVRGPDGAPLELVLAEVRSLGPGYRDGEAFALLFRGPADPVLPQATYALAHDRLGELEIFIVPVARGGEGASYEAIFT